MTPKKPSEYGVGETSDGNVDIFPPEELPARLAQVQAEEDAALGAGDDDVGPADGLEDEVEEVFGA